MKRWQVELPIVGRAVVEVKAASEADAISEAIGACSFEHIEEWDAMRQVVQGNVCYAPLTRAEASEISDD